MTTFQKIQKRPGRDKQPGLNFIYFFSKNSKVLITSFKSPLCCEYLPRYLTALMCAGLFFTLTIATPGAPGFDLFAIIVPIARIFFC